MIEWFKCCIYLLLLNIKSKSYEIDVKFRTIEDVNRICAPPDKLVHFVTDDEIYPCLKTCQIYFGNRSMCVPGKMPYCNKERRNCICKDPFEWTCSFGRMLLCEEDESDFTTNCICRDVDDVCTTARLAYIGDKCFCNFSLYRPTNKEGKYVTTTLSMYKTIKGVIEPLNNDDESYKMNKNVTEPLNNDDES